MTDDKGALARTVDSHGGIHYKDEAAAARHIVRQIVNDKDALEVWTRAVLDCNELADETISVGVNFVRRTINQWEKERAEAALNRAIIGGWTAARDQYGEPSRLAGQLAALRAAVEKVRDECDPLCECCEETKRALDAALRGGA